MLSSANQTRDTQGNILILEKDFTSPLSMSRQKNMPSVFYDEMKLLVS